MTVATKHSGLGRGFGELFQRTDFDDDERPDGDPADDVAVVEPVGSTLQLISVDKIRPNAHQPRKTFGEDELNELSESIRVVGVLQPVVVTPTDDGYELVMGERRWRAASKAGLATIPAIVRTTASEDMLRDALLENLHRVQLNPLEEAAAYEQMLNDFGCTQDELSERIQRSRSQIANTIRLLKLSAGVQKRLLEGDITAGHARCLLAIEDPNVQLDTANRVVDEGLSVRATEELVRQRLDDTTDVKPHRRKKPGRDTVAAKLGEQLSERYRTQVKVRRRNGKGAITFPFDGDEELERLIDILSN
ncbi:ParB/RepB/Spo0J family partition protein [Cutibacterium sp. WCA-380-WT-3A]|uniref:ParB/RepB/Spo0J family partition protein n=1 Tax=Cutibacterium porci TaxID=2605781 RepID=A0A7K0J402_9ACTN|nr:ParB/RepB/Spo0J family partition protein [Cutibacterium porci]MSS44670.1 ParB/RepB/Spo0J family partition protein [Cutibacterium porci]